MLSFTNPYMTLAALAYSFFLWGLGLRRNRRVHAALMNAGMGLDLALVLVLEFQRDAIATALGFSLTLPQQAHIACSSFAVLFYFPTLITGWKRLRRPTARPELRTWHLRFAFTAFALRTLGFLLMFSLLGHQR